MMMRTPSGNVMRKKKKITDRTMLDAGVRRTVPRYRGPGRATLTTGARASCKRQRMLFKALDTVHLSTPWRPGNRRQGQPAAFEARGRGEGISIRVSIFLPREERTDANMTWNRLHEHVSLHIPLSQNTVLSAIKNTHRTRGSVVRCSHRVKERSARLLGKVTDGEDEVRGVGGDCEGVSGCNNDDKNVLALPTCHRMAGSNCLMW